MPREPPVIKATLPSSERPTPLMLRRYFRTRDKATPAQTDASDCEAFSACDRKARRRPLDGRVSAAVRPERNLPLLQPAIRRNPLICFSHEDCQMATIPA